ncbi:hypothetical protein SAMN04487846_0503 [Microbacterium sp. cf046]|uniref:hypothetical protein n=1 Tax=Microbacterium sp. cf046 TaxID=1761803 RepID=UPI0008E9FC37|nr:hypothetical protein [Microbacterium sp. cf046]SFR90957.1 hypothetical protein SAMN04487846_0503 [Microbacterium sp. cf046]
MSPSGVRTAYVVLTHRDWPQAQRLATAILASSPDARVLLAHDGRRELFPSAVEDPRIEVFEHGRASDWGSWELVEATLDAFARARARFDPELVCLISGSDYPVRSLQDWERRAIDADSWIGTAEPLRYTPHWGTRRGEGDDRWTRYAYRWFRSPCARPDRRTWRWWVRLRTALVLRLEPLIGLRIVGRGRGLHYGVRRLPAPFTAQRPCFLGSQWLAVRRPELDRLLDRDFARGSTLRRIYAHAIIPDESALVTALSRVRAPSTQPPVTHVQWDTARDQPVTWTLEDLDELLASGSPFCRKVDPIASAGLLDELDRLSAA